MSTPSHRLTTVAVSPSLLSRLRRYAFMTSIEQGKRVTITSIVEAALVTYLDAHENSDSKSSSPAFSENPL